MLPAVVLIIAAGVGAIQSWSGNKKVAEGRATIIDSHPPNLVRVKLEFLKPFVAANTAEFAFKQDGDQTSLAWSRRGAQGTARPTFLDTL